MTVSSNLYPWLGPHSLLILFISAQLVANVWSVGGLCVCVAYYIHAYHMGPQFLMIYTQDGLVVLGQLLPGEII